MSRVLQLIDSLEAGGAERLSVSFANILVNETEASFLCATRAEGILKETINASVGYLFLEKQSSIDIKAILKLRKFVKQNRISTIHAHSTSFFIATLVKLIYPKVQLIWHDHYGQSEFLEQRPKRVLQFFSRFFSHIFCVNETLVKWSQQNLKCKKISYLQNFAMLIDSKKVTELKGEKGKRILCLANLRPQKDHLTLLKAFKVVMKTHADWTLHCVGKDFNDAYSSQVSQYINDNDLDNNVYLYGSCPDIKAILSQCDIGVLSSKSEGLPISLLEYGLAKLPVIVTDVGDCNLIIKSDKMGCLINSEDVEAIENAIITYIENKSERDVVSENLHKHVLHNFSKEAVLETLLNTYNN
ncbi:glycosyltransferase family 4 protein [Winogradskyella sp. UBA3174]|uniref:glycosyltransferase family 4 protein n=1 Tax=Winogradskyella sp. UBA3174 TaxID=1947785 RepID=UPI0025DDCF80|nr:glycosyltransferase family 4 protein [Winogradskyella sp. UBA3174]|tara:strand:+ start:77328 stop:78398 length:1071 start_codon:yes stop_codon:yes gene_type:complete